MISWFRHYPLILGSLVFSIVLWVWVHLGAEFQMELDVPLRVIGPAQKAAGPSVPEHIGVTVRTSGWKLLALVVNYKPECSLNFSSATRDRIVVTEKTLAQNVSLPEGIEVIDVSPDTLVVTFENIIERTLPVEEEVHIHCRNGFGIVGVAKKEPDSVRVRGARSLVEAMNACTTKSIELHDIHQPVHITVPFEDSHAHLLSYSMQTVTVDADVQALAEISIDNIPIEIRSVPMTKQIILMPATLSVTLRGGVEQLALVSRNDISASLDYRSVILDTTGKLRPVITLPEGIQLVKREPEYFQCIVRNAF